MPVLPVVNACCIWVISVCVIGKSRSSKRAPHAEVEQVSEQLAGWSIPFVGITEEHAVSAASA